VIAFCLIAAFLFGAVQGLVCGFLFFRGRLRDAEDEANYWFKEHEWLAKSVARHLDLRERDDADWWKEQA